MKMFSRKCHYFLLMGNEAIYNHSEGCWLSNNLSALLNVERFPLYGHQSNYIPCPLWYHATLMSISVKCSNSFVYKFILCFIRNPNIVNCSSDKYWNSLHSFKNQIKVICLLFLINPLSGLFPNLLMLPQSNKIND